MSFPAVPAVEAGEVPAAATLVDVREGDEWEARNGVDQLGRRPDPLDGDDAGDDAGDPWRADERAAGDRAPAELVPLFEAQAASRWLDVAARRMRALGEGFYTIGSAGHEANA